MSMGTILSFNLTPTKYLPLLGCLSDTTLEKLPWGDFWLDSCCRRWCCVCSGGARRVFLFFPAVTLLAVLSASLAKVLLSSLLLTAALFLPLFFSSSVVTFSAPPLACILVVVVVPSHFLWCLFKAFLTSSAVPGLRLHSAAKWRLSLSVNL